MLWIGVARCQEIVFSALGWFVSVAGSFECFRLMSLYSRWFSALRPGVAVYWEVVLSALGWCISVAGSFQCLALVLLCSKWCSVLFALVCSSSAHGF